MLKYLKKHWKWGLLAPLFMIGEVLMDLVQPDLMATIVDEGVLGLSSGGVGNMQIVLSAGLKMVAFVILGGFCGVMSGVTANLCTKRFSNDVRKACFERIMNLSFEQTDQFTTGSLVTRITNDVTQVENLVMQCIRGFIRTGMLFFGGIYCIIRLDLSFGILAACSLPFVAGCIFYFILKGTPIFGVLQDKLDKVNSVLQENVTGARVVKAYVREDHEKERFAAANDDLVNTQLRVSILFSYMMPIVNIIMNIVVLGIIYIGGLHVNSGNMTPGSIMAAITYTTHIQQSLLSLVGIFQTISRGNASAKRLKEVLDTEPVIRGGEFSGESAVKGKIEFRNASFSYNGEDSKQILHDINLTINPGETIGIMGATGCGKTSLINLIPRFYDVTAGEVLLDDVNVKDYDLVDLRDKVAIALQKAELFSVSIRENILWGDPNATDAEVVKAADIAQASEFINRQPQGLDTMVAEKGMSLSGGQKQRVAISRSVLKKAEVLIFDDATSALDLKTEANLYEQLEKEYPDQTKIIVAQRIASVKDADRIAVIENGTISAIGTHSELLQTSQAYKDIYNSQLKGAE